MESDFQNLPHNLFLSQQQQQQQPVSSGLTRFRSAPSSFFTSLLDRDFCDDFLNRPSSPDTDRIIARFFSGNDSTEDNDVANRKSSQFVGSSMKTEPGVEVNTIDNNNNNNNNNNNSQSYYSTEPPPVPSQNVNYGVVTTSSSATAAIDQLPPMSNGRRNSNLVRQSSSPAGLFTNIKVDQNGSAGFGSVKGMDDFVGANDGGTAYAQANRFSNQMNYLSSTASTMGKMTPIAESDNRSIQDVGVFGEGHGNNYVTGFPVGAWDDSDSYSGLKRGREDDDGRFSGLHGSEVQSEEFTSRPPTGLAHHLSLPKSSTELSAIEKFLQLQDSVPCKIRAKRGCATHPRSIAERVRRTKISERMRKLQDLVPNMDKQTNTADMLDLAVDYIKDLQNQVKILSADRAQCTCSNRH